MCVALAVLWCVPAVCVGFRGDFPLNDDWAFARAAEVLAETGRFERVPWMYALGYTHVAAGAAALAVSPLESSYETLRVLTWLCGLAGTFGVFALARRLGAEPVAASAAAATLALNALYTNLAFTFMSDVPFIALCTWSLYFWASPPERRVGGRILALLLAVAATLSRQPGAALVVAYAISLALPALRTRRRWLVASSTLVAAAAVVWVAARTTAPASRAAPFGVIGFAQQLLGPYVAYFEARHASVAFVYLGVFLAPLAVMVRPENAARARRMAMLGLAATLASLAALAATGLRMPLGLNMLHGAGVGPIAISGRELLEPLPAAFWWALTALGLASAFWLTGCALAAQRAREFVAERDAARIAIVAFALVYLGVVGARSPCFDRYLLVPLAPLAALLASHAHPSHARRLAAALLLAAFGLFGTLGLADYLAFQRARWGLLTPLVARGVAPERIDGGFEFGGRYLFGPKFRWVVDDEFVVALQPQLDGYRAIGAERFRRRLVPGTRVVTLYERAGASERR
ncbi:MAG TPA: glycosyltransferase family 39 protein [Myxococcota bacterium]|jgi:4-amino-4-deoxy-L-arabinose transferase-like glycosyltransferase